MDNLENYYLEESNNLLDRLSAVSDTSAEVYELFSTRFCSSEIVF
jgi:hypothetical protein